MVRPMRLSNQSVTPEELARLKWLLWHGNVFRALQTVQDLQIALDSEHPSIEQRKLLKAITEFGGYIRANSGWIPNCGERYRFRPRPSHLLMHPHPTPEATATVATLQYVRVANTGGIGVYLRNNPRMSDKSVPWPDGTRLEIIGLTSLPKAGCSGESPSAPKLPLHTSLNCPLAARADSAPWW